MPDTVIMILNKWIWLPLIHIMKHMNPMFFTVPVALLYKAACFAASRSSAVPCCDVLAACHFSSEGVSDCHQRSNVKEHCTQAVMTSGKT